MNVDSPAQAGADAAHAGPALARLLRAAADLHLAATEEEALRIVCAAMHDTGWGRVAAYAYSSEWQIAAAAFIGMRPEEEDELRNSRATVEQRKAMFGAPRASFRISRSYLIPFERRAEAKDSPPFVPSHVPDSPLGDWNPHDVAYTPLVGRDGAPIGLVMYDDPADHRRPDADALRYIEFFADAAARVIEQIRTMRRLRLTEYRLAAMLESMPDVVFYEGEDAPDLISRNLQSMLGVSAEEVERSPRGLSGLLDPRDVARVQARVAQWEREGAPGTLITRARMRTGEGGYRWIEDRAVRLPGPTGVMHRAGVMIDITDQVLTDHALREREERFRLVTLATREAIYDWNVLTGDVWRNDGIAAIVGTAQTSPDVEWWRQRIHPEDRERVHRGLLATLRGKGDHWEAEYRIRREDGDYAHVRDRCFIMRDPSGQAIRVIGAMGDITGRKRSEQRQALMLRELDHRVKNNLAAVIALADQTIRAAPSLEHFQRSFSGRLRALARTHSVLAQSSWRGASLEAIVRQTLEPYTVDDPQRLVVEGEEVLLPSRMAAPLALALNELATNAVKYGALSVPQGWVGVTWRRAEDPDLGSLLRIEWTERDGPPVQPPRTEGYGTRLIADEIQFELRGRAEITYAPDGLRCVILAPLQRDAAADRAGPAAPAAGATAQP